MGGKFKKKPTNEKKTKKWPMIMIESVCHSQVYENLPYSWKCVFYCDW
jgi:hypothetical protein